MSNGSNISSFNDSLSLSLSKIIEDKLFLSDLTRLRSHLFTYDKNRRELNAQDESFKHIKRLPKSDPYARIYYDLAVAEPDPLILEFSQLHPPPVDDLHIDNITFVKGCLPVEMAHLKHFDRPARTPDSKYAEAIRRAKRLTASLLKLSTCLPFPEKAALADVNYLPLKFAGIYYARKGYKSRESANSVAQRDAELAFDKMMTGKLVTPHDVRLGGRGKLAEVPKEVARLNPPPVGRLILMFSHRDLKLAGLTEQTLTKNYLEPKFPIGVGLSWYHGGSSAFVERILPYEEWFCLDAKKFDSSIDPWMVRAAINILRAQYHDGLNSKYNAYWQFIFDGLVSAPIFRDDGTRFQRSVGTTSGHSHNTLIQSIITIMLGYAVMFILNPEIDIEEMRDSCWMESLGDDNLIAVRGRLVGHSVKEISRVMMDAFGVDWSGTKSFKTTRVMDEKEGKFKGIQFLGKYWYLHRHKRDGKIIESPIPYRPAKETYLRLLYSEYGKPDEERTYLRALGNYLDAAGNTKMERWLSALLDWLDTKNIKVPSEWPDDYKRMVSRDYSNVGIEIPRPVRITRNQWYDLVLLSREEYVKVWGNRGLQKS